MFIAVPTEIDDGLSRDAIPTANAVIVALNVILFFLGIQTPVGPGTGWYSVVGYGLSHASMTHLLLNMWVLLVIGSAVNRRIGNAYYVVCYFGTVLTLGLFARFFAGQYLVGSSGAIFAVIAVMAMLLPSAWARITYVAVFPITLVIGLFVRPTHWLYWLLRWDTIRIRTIWLLFLVPTMQIVALFWWRWNWSNLAHLLGFACGVAFVTLLPTTVSMRRASPATMWT
ncbi:MAG TPA: rhomboid family intramembrane serine protease [Lacipirellulaceae bacterium]|jgi:membrane associated rhomboid family serine protease|nr:rhomboid family intramembrane serine protease [Lacipirellulaceae bacterium]